MLKEGTVISTIEYALRYLNRMVIAEKNILGYSNSRVRWRPKANRYENEASRKLVEQSNHVFDFIEKLLIHIPDKSERAIYYAGLYAPCEKRHRLKLAKAHFSKSEKTLEVLEQSAEPEVMDWETMRTWHAPKGIPCNPLICPDCGGKAVFVKREYYDSDFCETHILKNNQILSINDTG